MRLTLRTLLAYLDDTLPPGEIRAIGQKVAESDTAQELIERIKQVTRRRRLTTPPTTGTGALDANTTAEYLDNELSTDQVAELEKLAIESDVHLAELAACHQILTLVLGEPAQVPPTARERMYGLVQGRESLTSRRAPRPQRASAEGPDQDADENLLPGLSVFHQAPWLRWALPLAGALLLVIIGIALGRLLFPPASGNERASNDRDGTDLKGQETPRPPENDTTRKTNETKQVPPRTDSPKPEEKKPEEKKPTEDPKPVKDPIRIQTPAPPSKDRVKLGRYQAYVGKPSILVARNGNGTGDWQRVLENGDVHSADQLVSLPGYASEINLPNGGQILLRGMIPEMARNYLTYFLLESVVTLHNPAPADAFDVDLTLNRGRVYLINNKDVGPLKIRLRLATEVWDLELKEPGTEVGVDLNRQYPAKINWQDEEPLIDAVLVALKGKVSLKRDAHTFPNMEPPPGPENFYHWNNKGPLPTGPSKTNEELIRLVWDKLPPMNKERGRELEQAPQELSLLMGPKKAPGPALSEAIASDSRGKRVLAIYALGALDLSAKLIDVLGDGDEAHDYERHTAVFVLNCWLTHGLGTSKILYDPASKMGEFTQKGYTIDEAKNCVALLHDFSNDDARKPEIYQYLLLHMNDRNRVALRELAWRQLQSLARQTAPGIQPVKLPNFNAAWSEQMRKPALDEIEKLIREGKLPPVPPSGPPDPPR